MCACENIFTFNFLVLTGRDTLCLVIKIYQVYQGPRFLLLLTHVHTVKTKTALYGNPNSYKY